MFALENFVKRMVYRWYGIDGWYIDGMDPKNEIDVKAGTFICWCSREVIKLLFI